MYNYDVAKRAVNCILILELVCIFAVACIQGELEDVFKLIAMYWVFMQLAYKNMVTCLFNVSVMLYTFTVFIMAGAGTNTIITGVMFLMSIAILVLNIVFREERKDRKLKKKLRKKHNMFK